MNMIKNIYADKVTYLKNLELVSEYFQVCQWVYGLLMYRVCLTKRPREVYDSAWQIFE